MELAIYGAFDRMNYGDLLFPVVLKRLYREVLGPDVNVRLFASSSVNAGEWGLNGSIECFGEFIRSEKFGEHLLVIAGGEVLGADWIDASHTLAEKLGLDTRIVRRLAGRSKANRYLGWKHGHGLQGPYLVDSKVLAPRTRVVYQTVGGSGISEKPVDYQLDVKCALTGAFDLSVRDHETCRQVSELLGVSAEVRVAPDSVVELSRLFPLEELRRRSRAYVREIVDRLSGPGYISFQCSEPFSKGREGEIAAELERVSRVTGKPLVFVSIGRAFMHMDHIALERIKDRLSIEVIMPDETHIFEIAYLIASSSAFVGTSLHGAITSISYGIPHVAANRRSRKLACFLESWDVDEQKDCVDVPEISSKLQQVLTLRRSDLMKSSERLIGLSRKSFSELGLRLRSKAEVTRSTLRQAKRVEMKDDCSAG